jgi:hypothetical protein
MSRPAAIESVREKYQSIPTKSLKQHPGGESKLVRRPTSGPAVDKEAARALKPILA